MSQHEVIRLLAEYALGQKHFDLCGEFDPAALIALGGLQREPLVEQIDVAHAKGEYFGFAPTVTEADCQKGPQPQPLAFLQSAL